MHAVEVSDELATVCAFDDALAYLNRLSPELSRDPNILLQKARLLSHRDRIPESMAQLALIREEELTAPGRAAVLLTRGLNLSAMKQQDKAIKALARARELGGDAALIANAEGIVYVEAGDYERAEHSFEAALKIDPKLPSALINLAEMKARRGQIDEAVELVRKSWRAGQRDPEKMRRDPLLKPLVESGRIDDLLNSPVGECVL